MPTKVSCVSSRYRHCEHECAGCRYGFALAGQWHRGTVAVWDRSMARKAVKVGRGDSGKGRKTGAGMCLRERERCKGTPRRKCRQRVIWGSVGGVAVVGGMVV